MKALCDYSIYCTIEQTKKALGLGAKIEKKEIQLCDNAKHFFWYDGFYYNYPTAEQMIGFLRRKGVRFYLNDITTIWQVVCNHKIIGQGCSENKELAAIDAALEYLTNNNK